MSKDSNVLFVSGTLGVGGSETKIVKIANALARSGYSAAIAYLNPPETLLEKINPNVPVTHLHRRGKFSINSLRRLHSLVVSKYRVVVAVNFYPLLYVVPAVKFLTPRQGRAICLINTTDFVDGQWVVGPIYAPFLRLCDQLVFGCQAQQKLWTRKYKLPVQGSTSIYNGVDSEFFSPEIDFKGTDDFRAKFGIPKDAIVIGSVGRFAPEKNQELLIKALGNLNASGRDAYLILIGDGEQRGALEAAAVSNELVDKIVLPGVLKDVRPAISAMDIFVLPSRAVETFSNAALEAMSMARPVVLSNIGGAAEMVEHNQSGYLFDSGNIDMLTDFLTKLYDSKPERDRVASAARQRVKERFHFTAMLDSYKALIDSAIDSIESKNDTC